ncbi:hypothetical protein NQ314_004081, partial [Rhamnusium bicolor]
VFSPCRILLLTAKVPTKIDCHFHYLEIQALESKRGNQLSLTVNDKVYSFLVGEDSKCSTEVDNMIGALNNAIRNIFPTVPLHHIIRKIEVIPNTRLQQLRDLEAIASSRREVGPCGGFSTQYACMCDFHGMTYREEVAWDVDNIYVSLNTRELSLKDFEYLDQKGELTGLKGEENTRGNQVMINQLVEKFVKFEKSVKRVSEIAIQMDTDLQKTHNNKLIIYGVREAENEDLILSMVNIINNNLNVTDDFFDKKIMIYQTVTNMAQEKKTSQGQLDLIPIISALEYNTWFTKLRANQVKLSHDNIDRILHVLRKSLNLEEIYLDNLALKADFINKLSNVLKLNLATALHTIDLSFNPIEDKGATYLGTCIPKLNKGLVHLNLAHCGLSSKGINNLFSALCNNSSSLTTLNYLNLSGNSLKDDISHFHNFLSQPNALQHVDISSTDIILENLFGALVRGCTTNLVHLNISKNPFSSKKSKEAPISFKQFFSTTLNLKYLNMSHCKLPQEALKIEKTPKVDFDYTSFTEESSMNVDKDEERFGPVKYNKRRPVIHKNFAAKIILNEQATSGFSSAPKKVWLHIYRVNRHVNEEMIMQYIKAKPGFENEEILAVQSTKVGPVINFLTTVIDMFGLPRWIVSNRGSCFTCKRFARFCQNLGIKTTAIPRANGQVERMNRTILSSLADTLEKCEKADIQTAGLLKDIENSRRGEYKDYSGAKQSKVKERFDAQCKMCTCFSYRGVNLLLGLACNEFTKEMTLDISNCGLGSQGAHVLESCVHGVRCISSLDISENNMDSDLCNVVIAISKNKSLKHLNMGRSMKKHMSLIMDSVVQVVQDDECLLQSLIIPDCRLRSDMFNLLNALGDNKSLEILDISGNLIGDSGARLLAKALQINNKLKTIICDRNNITLQGYNDLAYALESNRTVQYIPFPIFDITPCMKANTERTDVLMRKIQDLLNRNISDKQHKLKSFPLQPGFLLTSKQQALDRLVTQTQEAIKNLASESIASNNDINHATGVIQDAENSKQLLVRLQEVAQHRNDKHPVEDKLQQVACDIHASICDYIQTTTDKMLKCCKDQCPYVLHDEQTVQEIKKECKKKKQIPLDFVTTCIKQQAGVDIMNRTR